ncbi:MAG: Rpn family recombination-promoting nuclease/putative transposase [Treponema sp.]|nr:Rpn family recombination-promoting nuclease/putative transposase [Treponema sp.]
MDEQEDLIDIRFDNVFKAVFTKETPESMGALAKLLTALIGREIASVHITTNEPAIENLRDRQVRFDMQCKLSDGDYVNVEMSMNPDKFEPVRLEFYAGKLFTGQDIRGTGKSYGELKMAYQIAFLANRDFFEDAGFMHKFEYYDSRLGIPLGGRSRIITVELSKLSSLEEKPASAMSGAERWAFYFRYLTEKGRRQKINEILWYEEGIAMASEVLVKISRDEVERARLISEYKYEVDMQSKMVEAKREGIQEGRLAGISEGRSAGRLEERKETAKKLRAMGIPLDMITRVTGLSAEEIVGL